MPRLRGASALRRARAGLARCSVLPGTAMPPDLARFGRDPLRAFATSPRERADGALADVLDRTAPFEPAGPGSTGLERRSDTPISREPRRPTIAAVEAHQDATVGGQRHAAPDAGSRHLPPAAARATPTPIARTATERSTNAPSHQESGGGNIDPTWPPAVERRSAFLRALAVTGGSTPVRLPTRGSPPVEPRARPRHTNGPVGSTTEVQNVGSGRSSSDLDHRSARRPDEQTGSHDPPAPASHVPAPAVHDRARPAADPIDQRRAEWQAAAPSAASRVRNDVRPPVDLAGLASWWNEAASDPQPDGTEPVARRTGVRSQAGPHDREQQGHSHGTEPTVSWLDRDTLQSTFQGLLEQALLDEARADGIEVRP